MLEREQEAPSTRMITDELQGYCQGRCLNHSCAAVPKSSLVSVCLSVCSLVELICHNGDGLQRQKSAEDSVFQDSVVDKI